MDDELIEQVAELQLAAFLAGRGSVSSVMNGNRVAKPAPSMDDFRRMAIAAMQPHIAAEREDAARRALEAAATVPPSKTPSGECETVGQWTRRTLREAIRAIDPAQFRRPADG